MLARMQEKGIFSVYGNTISVTTFKSNVEIPQKTINRHTVQSSNNTPGHISKGM
jgi:hypothetical protein